MIEDKRIRVCDFCGKELQESYVYTTPVYDSQPSEAGNPVAEFSFIRRKTKNENDLHFGVGDQDYCNLKCLFNAIEKRLGTGGEK